MGSRQLNKAMPSRVGQITRTSKTRIVYRSLAPNFTLLPVTGELKTVINAQAIAQAIRNVIFTFPTERYYRLDIGSTIPRDLFEFADEFTADRIKSTILTTLQNYEPRAQNPTVVVTPFPQDNYFNVDVTFNIAALPQQLFSVPTVVVKVRG